MTKLFCIDAAGGWRRFFVCILLVACSISSAIVLHPDGDPNLSVWTDRPSNFVVGRWSTNASCVAIAPDLILSVKHQGGDIGTDIVLGSTTYKVSQLVNLSVDLRVARITTQAGTAANLTEYAPLHTGTNETGNAIVLGGFGKGRNITLANGGIPYGYTWKNESNLTRRWGTNNIDWLANLDTPYGATDLLQADFDDLASNIQKSLRSFANSSVYEAIPAEYDSGGGWFIKNSVTGQWHLAGITAYLANSRAESWFRSSTDPIQLMPDIFYGIRISSYDDQITPIINWMSNAVIISGHVFNFQNNPVSGITINSNNGTGYTKTDSNGYFEIWVANGWSGTVTPSFSGSNFNPANYLYTSITSDVNNQNFYIDTIMVSGTVYDNNLPVQNVIIDANSQVSTTTDINGFYQLHLYSGFSGNITPSKSGYVMTPEFRTYSNITSDLTGQNFDVKAPILIDDFNDNTRSANWVIKNPSSIAAIIETNQRLEISSLNDINPAEAFYSANGWKISSTQNFAIKTDFHNEAITEFFTGVAIRLVDPNASENYIQLSAASEANQPIFNVQANINGVLTHNSINRDHNDGSLWISYNYDTNEIYLSSTSFGPADAFQIVSLPEKIDWIVEMTGFTENFGFASGFAWLDNFTIQTGQLMDWPPKTDINQNGFIEIEDLAEMAGQWLSIGGGFSADIDVDGDVDFADFARFAEVW